ncbi:MAG: hypothetical protein AAF591_15975 [Verrucomicrobiota bacterium]
MPHGPEQDKTTFSEAHERWVEKYHLTRWDRFVHGVLLPAPGTTGLNWILGTAARGIAFLFLLAGIYSFALKKHLGSAAFADSVATQCETLLNADSVTCSAITWKGNEAFITVLEASGSPDAFFTSLHAEGIRFEIPWTARFNPAWHLQNLSISDLDIKLRSGARNTSSPSAYTPPIPINPRPPKPLQAGLGVRPNLLELTFDEILVDQANISWGRIESTRGRLADATLHITRNQDRWRLNCSSGTISQNWLRGLNLSSLEIEYQHPTILLKNGNATLGDTGNLSLEGTVLVSEFPTPEVNLYLDNVSLSNLLPPSATSLLNANIDGTLKIGGSLNTEEGISINGEMTFLDGVVRDLDFLSTLSAIYADSRFRRLHITAGNANFTSQNDHFNVSEFSLIFGSFGELGGFFTAEPPKYPLKGNFAFGVQPDILDPLPEFSRLVFGQHQLGKNWTVFPINAPIPSLTKNFANQLAAAARNLDASKSRPSR